MEQSNRPDFPGKWRVKVLTAQDIARRSCDFERSHGPSQRVISEPSGNAKWKASVLRASAAIVAAATLVWASSQVSPKFFNKTSETLPTSVSTLNSGTSTALLDKQVDAVAVPPFTPNVKFTASDTEKKEEIRVDLRLPPFNAALFTLSEAYIEQLKLNEGKRLKSYLDNGKGSTWTIGYGHTGLMPDGRPIGAGMTITDEEADALLYLDLEEHRNHVIEILGNTPVTQGQFEALVDFSFNKGPERLAESTLLRRLIEGDPIAAANEYLRWTKITRRDANGNPVLDEQGRRIMDELPGLVKRAHEQRDHMLSSFSSSVLDVLDRGVSGVQVIARSTARSEQRLKPVQITGTRIDRMAASLSLNATAIDKHVVQLQKKIDANGLLIDRLHGEARELEERYKQEMRLAGSHLDASNNHWRSIMDLSNQVHVLRHIAMLRTIEQDKDLRALKRYQAQIDAYSYTAQALKDASAVIHQKNANPAVIAKSFDALTAAIDKLADLTDDPDATYAKTLLEGQHSTRLLAAIEKLGERLESKLQDLEQSPAHLAYAKPH